MNILPPSSRPKSKSNQGTAKEAVRERFLSLRGDPEDGGNMFLRNISKVLPDYTALHLIR
jgi:hypothetical protein